MKTFLRDFWIGKPKEGFRFFAQLFFDSAHGLFYYSLGKPLVGARALESHAPTAPMLNCESARSWQERSSDRERRRLEFEGNGGASIFFRGFVSRLSTRKVQLQLGANEQNKQGSKDGEDNTGRVKLSTFLWA